MYNIQLNYKQDFEKNKGKMLGTDVTPEMARAHEMEPIRNKQKYQEQAKKDLVKTHVGPGKLGENKNLKVLIYLFSNFEYFFRRSGNSSFSCNVSPSKPACL